MENYKRLVERISKASNLEGEDIDRKVEAKRAKLSGLVSKEGAAQIVAAELGINLDQVRLKIAELVDGMRGANVVGKVLEISPVREFERGGRNGKVVNLRVADDSSNAKVVFWDTNHIALVENGEINVGDIIEVSNSNVRNMELHLGSFSDVKKSTEEVGNVVMNKVYGSKRFCDVRNGDIISTRAVIVQSFEPRYFEVNAETGKKVTDEEKNNGKVRIDKRAVLNIVLDDGSETIRGVLFGDVINKLGLENEDILDLSKFKTRKDDLLGEELVFSGNLRNNDYFNILEFYIDDIGKVNGDELIKELEAKA